jgi:sugar lactone lactonase YvrE
MSGHLYVADTYNLKIRKVDITTGFVETVQSPDGVFYRPIGVAFDATTGSIYVSDVHKKTLEKIDGGAVTTIAGKTGIEGSADGLGTVALFRSSFGLAVDRVGNIYVCDSGNNTIRKIDTKGEVTTIAGKAGVPGSNDGLGIRDSLFNNPTSIAVDDEGNIYVTDTNNFTIRKLTYTGPKFLPSQEASATQEDANTRGTARSSNIGQAAGNAATSSVEAGDDGGEEDLGFRYSLNPQQLKLGMQSMKKNDYRSGGYDRVYSKTLETLEKTLGSTQAIRDNGMGLTFWVSGLYSQGQSKPIYGNPSMKEQHYGIISGCHYTHKPTGQTIGLPLDIGIGNSFANVDHEMKSTHHTGQMTIYYHKTLDKNWKFNVNGSFMRSADRHQRPYTAQIMALIT